MSDETFPEVDQIRLANNARLQYLAEHGVQVPLDLLYATSLLEFLIGPQIEAAREFHQQRLAGVLDNAVAGLAAVEEHRRQADIRARLLLPGQH